MPSSGATVKLNDLSKLEKKLSGQIQEVSTFLDGKFDRLIGLFNSTGETSSRVDARREHRDSTDTACVRSALMDGYVSLVDLVIKTNIIYYLCNLVSRSVMQLVYCLIMEMKGL